MKLTHNILIIALAIGEPMTFALSAQNPDKEQIALHHLQIPATFSLSAPGMSRLVEIDTFQVTESLFQNNLILDSARYNSNVMFGKNVVKKHSYIRNAHFQSDSVLFLGSEFGKSLHFDSTSFDGTVIFSYCKFGTKVSFNDTRFKQPPSFYGTILPDTLLLENMDLSLIPDAIDFRYCLLDSAMFEAKRKCIVIVTGTDVRKLILPSHLFTLGFNYHNSYFDPALPNNHDAIFNDKTRIYEQLVKNDLDLGQVSSAQGWDIEYQILKNNKYPLGFALNFLNRHWWNFGYDKWKIIWWWIPAFYLLFCLMNFIILDWLVKSVYCDAEVGKYYNLSYSNIASPQDKIAYTLFYTSSIYFNFEMKHEAVNYKNILGLVYIFIVYAVGTINVTFGILGYILKT